MKTMNTPDAQGQAPGTHDIELDQSVAGEEDPGASSDLTAADQPAGPRAGQPTGATPPMAPGDEAPPGTPGTGEDLCPDCGGTGKKGGQACPTCEGTGRVTVGIGGA